MQLQINDTDTSFNVLFYHNPSPMWIVEVETLQFKAVNDAAIKHYGYSREEFLNDITLANIRPFYEQQDMLNLIKRIRHNQTIKRELHHIKKDGSLIFVNITSYTVDYHNTHCRMVMIHDVTVQKQKDKRLTEAVDKINETLESITDGFFTLNNTLRITYWNKVAEQILAIDRKEVLRKKLWSVYPYYRELAIYKQFYGAYETKQTAKFEEYIAPIDKWLSFTVYPGNDGLAVYFQDITSQKHGEEQITLKDKSLNHIAYMNSHLMRKPLANIMGIINSLDESLHQHEDFKEPLDLLKQSALELDTIIKDINASVEQTMK